MSVDRIENRGRILRTVQRGVIETVDDYSLFFFMRLFHFGTNDDVGTLWAWGWWSSTRSCKVDHPWFLLQDPHTFAKSCIGTPKLGLGMTVRWYHHLSQDSHFWARQGRLCQFPMSFVSSHHDVVRWWDWYIINQDLSSVQIGTSDILLGCNYINLRLSSIKQDSIWYC
jgi:hypothetical protein